MADPEDPLDALYAEGPEGFIAARDALAKKLKAQGDQEAAKAVQAARKPTREAHALNQVPRLAPRELAELLEAGRALASGKNFKAALERQRAAEEGLRRKLEGPHAPQVLAVLRGAMADEELGKRVLEGRFAKLPEAPVGFLGAAPAEEAPRQTKAEEKAAAREEQARQRAAEAERRARLLAEAEEEAARLEGEAERAEEAAAKARGRADEAARRVRELSRG